MMQHTFYQKIKDIVDQSDMYYLIKQKVDNRFKVEIANYRFFTYEEFKKYPIEYAREIRGIAFIDGIPYPSISKFFNLNENDLAVKIDELPDNIVALDKLDGSLISPIILPDGRVYLKSKGSVQSEQAIKANRLLAEKYGKNTIKAILRLIEDGLYPQFEYIAPDNRIVIRYSQPELVLIAVRTKNRDNEIFGYLEPEYLKDIARQLGVPMANYFILTKDELLYNLRYKKGIEGYVLYTHKGLAKAKTKWYIEQHSIYTKLLASEKGILQLVLEDKLDDTLALIDDKEQKERVQQYASKIRAYLNQTAAELWNLKLELDKLGPRDFALKYKDKARLIGILKRIKTNKDAQETAVNNLRKLKTRREIAELFGCFNNKT